MNAWYRKNVYAFAAIFMLFSGILINAVTACATEKEQPRLIIALDPGHGGDETGACYYGMEEKTVNLKMAKMVKQGLEEYKGVAVMLTREGDETVSLGERAVRAREQKADVLISMHLNASMFHKSKGATIYISTSEGYREQLLTMADYLLGEFEALGLQNDGTIARVTQKGRRRADGSFDDYYGVIRHGYNNGMPSLLIEHCFMDSKEDHEYLKTEEGIEQLARADVNGIASYYNLERKDGSEHLKRQAKVYGATTRGIELDYYEPPVVSDVQLVEYDNVSPSIATYQVSVEDGAGIDSLALHYMNSLGETALIYPKIIEPLKTGTYDLKAYIPDRLRKDGYRLIFVGAHNVAGYESAYNYSGGEMIGFGKCKWINRFPYNGDAGFQVKKHGSIEWTKSRWMDYEVSIGIRDSRRFFIGHLYPD